MRDAEETGGADEIETRVVWLTEAARWHVTVRYRGRLYALGSYALHGDAVEVQRQIEASLRDEMLGEAVARMLRELPDPAGG